jgi:hypothetical protein
LLDGGQELEPRRARHHEVRQDHVDLVGSHLLEGALGVERREDAHPLAQEDLLQRFDVGALVVHHEDRDGVARRRRRTATWGGGLSAGTGGRRRGRRLHGFVQGFTPKRQVVKHL